MTSSLVFVKASLLVWALNSVGLFSSPGRKRSKAGGSVIPSPHREFSLLQVSSVDSQPSAVPDTAALL